MNSLRELVINEHKGMSREALYLTYKFLVNNYNEVASCEFTLQTRGIEEELIFKDNFRYFILNRRKFDYWQELKIKLERDKWRLKEYIYSKTGMKKDSSSLWRYESIILHHLLPQEEEDIQRYKEEVQKIIDKEREEEEEKQKLGGIYGIYEDNKLVYIGMTTRDFQKRWKEHQQKINEGSKELALYSLINKKAKIEYKVLFSRNEMKSNDEITKRDLQAMEFVLIQEHKPKYNFAGNTQAYVF